MRWLRAALFPASLLVIAIAAFTVTLPLYLERPGRVVPLSACVDVEAPEATAVDGAYLLMTISVRAGTPIGALLAAFEDDTAVVARRAIIPPGVDAATFFERQRHVFDATRDIAAVVALQEAGLPARVTGDGVSVIQVAPDTPAAGALEPGDIITAIDGDAVRTEADLREAILSATPGEPLTLQVTRRAESMEVEVAPVVMEGAPRLGVVPETVDPRVTLPVPVEVASGNVGGPSAGLTIALTVYDMVLPDVDLAAGRIVAGTGTIDQSGRIGPVGGAGLKVIAAHRRDADIFLVPRANLDDAEAALPQDSSMEIVAVDTFDDAVATLERGGAAAGGAGAGEERCPYDKAA